MPAAFTVVVPEPLRSLGRWHFSVEDSLAACGEHLHLAPGPTTVTITLQQQARDACFACTAVAILEVVVPTHGSLTVLFPTARASGVVSSAAHFLADIIRQTTHKGR
jgi:hypothetical protein